MRITFSNSSFSPLEIPEANLVAVLSPQEGAEPAPVAHLAESALDHPIGSQPLERLAAPRSKVLLLVDDITRQTPAWALVPSLLRRLAQAGVSREDIRILIAAGTHTRMTREELEGKLGAEILKGFSVTLHHWRDEENLKTIGATENGTPIRVNRMLGEADIVIGVGQIVPHRVMGFTGGASIVQPGVSGPEITGHTHWMSAFYTGAQIMGIAANPVRLEVEKIARLAGLRFIVNVVMDSRHRVKHVVAGDPVEAHRQGAEYSAAIFGASQPALADIVVAESYPADYDLWQAGKGIYAAELAVRPGGTVILITPCPHGVSEEHPEVEKFGYLSFREVRELVERKELRDLVAAAHIAHVGRVIREIARGIMVSPGIASEVERRIGFEPAASPQLAVEKALAQQGPAASVVILKQGGNILPVVAEHSATQSLAPAGS